MRSFGEGRTRPPDLQPPWENHLHRKRERGENPEREKMVYPKGRKDKQNKCS